MLFCTFICSREFEPIRLLSLQFIGRLLVGLPAEKKGSIFFNLSAGKFKSLPEIDRKVRMQPIFLAISERLFSFPRTDNLCATLFDVLLGGASPKQVFGHIVELFSFLIYFHQFGHSLNGFQVN